MRFLVSDFIGNIGGSVGFVQGSAYQYTLLLLSLLFLQVSWVPGVFPYVCFNMQMQKNATYHFRNFDAFVIRIKFPSHVHYKYSLIIHIFVFLSLSHTYFITMISY